MKLHIQFLLPADTFTPAACLPQPPGNGAIQSVRGSRCAPRPQQHAQYVHTLMHERTHIGPLTSQLVAAVVGGPLEIAAV